MQETSSFEIDELDLRLIEELEKDARQISTDLAKKLGTSPITIRRRLRNLVDAGVISFVTSTDLGVLGTHALLFMGINALPKQSDALADYLGSCKNVRAVIQTTGCYDLVIATVFQTPRQVMDFIHEELGSLPAIAHVEAMTVWETVKFSYSYLTNNRLPLQTAKARDFDSSEIKLIEALGLNPRKSISGLSKTIGMSRKATRQILQRLLADNVIRVSSVANPSALGFYTPAVILVKVHPGKVRALANAVATDSRVRHVRLVTGRFDMYVSAVFRDSREMSDFLKNDLGDVPGVVNYEVMLKRKLPKISFGLVNRGQLL